MANDLREKLDNAIGTPDNVIALILDIRGFTPFCKEQESVDVANFIKRIYIRIIDDYFPKAKFYKPTGDGLLIVISYSPTSLKDLLIETVQKSLSLVQDFGKLREGDEMIYFPTPDKVGIGISRGLACCISSGETILDYSGRVINLASRLNDFARPCGVVFDPSVGISLLPKETQDKFLSEEVFIRGIAEDKPIFVHFSKQYTIIPASRRQPLEEPVWGTQEHKLPFKHIRDSFNEGTETYAIPIDKPIDERQLYLEISYVTTTGKKTALYDINSKGIWFERRGKKQYVHIDYDSLIDLLGRCKALDDSNVTIELTYPFTEK